MKKILVVFLMMLLAAISFAEVITINNNPFSVNVLSSSENETVIEYNLGSFEREPVIIDGETYYDITLAKEANSYEKGAPSLPFITRSIIIPDASLMNVSILESEYVEYNMQVLPSKGILSRQINPADVPYSFSDVYGQNSFYPEATALLGEPYIMRDFRGITVKAQPFVYNPQTKVLRVYTHLVLEVNAIGIDTRNVKIRTNRTRNVYFGEIYRNHFINYNTLRYDTVEEQGRMIVISHADFIDTMMPLVNWKIQKGIQCDIYDVDIIGSSASAIDAFIEDEYELGDGLTFVLLVGDAGQIPANNGNQDPTYGCIEGGDFYPEIFISRFSAETVAHTETQVERTLYYERDVVDGDWLHKGLGVASNIGTGDDNEYDDEHMDSIRVKLLDYTFTEIGQEYDPDGSVDGAMNTLNDGTTIVNYCGHGNTISWGNGAQLNNSSVNDLENDNMLPFITSVACLNGNFTESTCFAETWLRATNDSDGDPTGAIAFYGSTINQSWDPPMRGQDHAIDLLVGWNYSTNIEIAQKFTLGGLWFNGSCNMMDVYEYGGAGINEFKHWTIFGDASLNVRTDTPEEMAVSSQPTLFIGVNTFDVYTGVENALVCMSYENEILGSGYTDDAGFISLGLENVPTVPTDLILTITANNKITYIQDIQLIPNDGPYMIVENYLPNAGGDDYIEAGETVYLQISLFNLGAEEAEDVNMTIATDDTYITVTDNNEEFGLVESGETVTVENAFCFEVSEITPDLHNIQLTVLITSGAYTWNSFINFIAYEPNVFSVNPEYYDVAMNLDEVRNDVLSIINNSDRVVNYTIRTQEPYGDRNLTGSYIICSTDEFEPGETVDWYFTVYNVSPDNEWVTDVNIEFPAGVTVNNATNFVGGSGGDLVYDETTGEAVSLNWHGETTLGYGLLHSGQAATAMVNVTTTTEFAGNIVLAYDIVGDGYGDDPHIIYGTMDIDYPLSWISLASSSGTLQGSETHEIAVTFDSEDLIEGIYECEIFISDVDERDYIRVPVSLTVSTVDADDDAIVTGNIHLGNYPNPFNPVTTISFSIENDVDTATIDIYNIMGQKVKSFNIDTSNHQPSYSVVWDGTDDRGYSTASGIYFSKLKAGRFTSTKKMILMK